MCCKHSILWRNDARMAGTKSWLLMSQKSMLSTWCTAAAEKSRPRVPAQPASEWTLSSRLSLPPDSWGSLPSKLSLPPGCWSLSTRHSLLPDSWVSLSSKLSLLPDSQLSPPSELLWELLSPTSLSISAEQPSSFQPSLHCGQW